MAPPESTPSTASPPQAEALRTPLRYLRGVGSHRGEVLAKIGLHTVTDLLFFFPRTYEDLSARRSIADLAEGELQSIVCEVQEVDSRTTGGGKSLLGVLVSDGTGHLRCVWFNQPFMRPRFAVGQQLLVSGKPKRHANRWEVAHPRVVWLESPDEADEMSALLPVYALTDGIPQHRMRNIVRRAVEEFGTLPAEVFPQHLLERYRLLPISAAIRQIHTPQDETQRNAARRRFVFQELLILQLALAVRRWQQHVEQRSPPLPPLAKINARIERLFPFELTDGQRRVIGEISSDMALERPMNRLLQGDVGSGKTVAAVYAMLLAVAHGHQAALMAPTEILARQHARTLAGILAESRVEWTLLTGGIGPAARRDALARIADGDVDIVIGTHAISGEDVEFKSLAVVVIDEQHKFGVRQRAQLRRGKLSPHYLVMTATPIPRTVTMAVFGDLDVSALREMPPGRQPLHTYIVEEEDAARWWEFVRKELRSGRQGYVITPLIEESEHVRGGSVDEAFEELANGPLADFRIDLIHGRMSTTDQQRVMESFYDGTTQVLVGTSVVEVGVDVPNATVMTIFRGERFGLAQLHQLRGRVSRGQQPGYCGVLRSPTETESAGEDASAVGASDGSTADERLAAFAETRDGFELAEVDFRLRGPGDLLGTRQHGLPPLRAANLLRDAEVLAEARREAQLLVAEDPGLRHPQHAALRRMMLVRYGTVLELGDVG